jgi:hypothetical protein
MDRFKVRPTIRVAGIPRLKAEVIQRRHNQQLDNYVGLLFTNILVSSQGHKHTKNAYIYVYAWSGFRTKDPRVQVIEIWPRHRPHHPTKSGLSVAGKRQTVTYAKRYSGNHKEEIGLKLKCTLKKQVMKVCTGQNWRPSLDGVLSRQASLNAGSYYTNGTKITLSRTQFHSLSYIGPCYIKLYQPAEQAIIKRTFSDKPLSSAVKVCDKIHTVNIKRFFLCILQSKRNEKGLRSHILTRN